MNRWLLLWLWCPLLAGAQSPVVLHGTPAWTQPVDIAQQVRQFNDVSGLPLPFNAIQRQAFRPFVPHQMGELRPSAVTEIVTWLTFRVQNTHPAQPADVLFQVGRQGQIDLFSATGHLLQRTGTYLIPYNVQDWKPLSLHIMPGQTSTFFVKVTNRVRIIEPIVATLHTPASLRAWFAINSHHIRWLFLGLTIIAGGLFTMSIFALAQYYFNREYVFLYYAIFCLSIFCLVITNMSFRFGLGLPVSMRSTNQYLTFIIAFFYLLFVESLAKLSASSPKLWRILQGFLVLFVLQECVIIYEYQYGLLSDKTGFIYGRSSHLSWQVFSFLLLCCAVKAHSEIICWQESGHYGSFPISKCSSIFDLPVVAHH